MTLTHPLRLAVGSHQAGSGKGCAMNVMSWENGDTTITDLPDCADRLLAKIVQRVNDTLCTHRDGDLLCPDCSVKVLELAHRTVGTGGVFDLDRHRVWVRIAAEQARQVLHLARDRAATEAWIRAAEVWADDPSEVNRQAAWKAHSNATAAAAAAVYAAAAATAAAVAAATAAADAAVYAAAAAAAVYAAADAVAAAAVYAAADAVAVEVADVRLGLAHRAIDTFIALTGHVEHVINPAITEQAIAAMSTR